MEPGSTLAGRYRIDSILGRGGMGIVFEATHIQLETQVAIKMLRKEALEEPDLIERFLREARSTARLKSEHVCRVTDFGTTDEGLPFMAMELLEGEDLRVMLDRGPLDVAQTATFVMQACVGVAEAHALGIIHRDLKPGNLFLTRRADGRRSVKLLDFGIAKSTMNVDQSLTATTKAMGSPAYMAPEQLRSAQNIDTRSDIWSLGVTMYELLTDKRPFDGDTPYELALAIANDPPAPLDASVPADFAKVVMRCLEKDRTNRYQDVGELAAALAPFSKYGADLLPAVRTALVPRVRASSPRDPRLDTPSPQTETTMRGASGAIVSQGTQRRRRIAIPMLVVGVLAVAVGVLWWQRQSVGGDDELPGLPASQPAPPQPQPQPQPPPPPPPPPVAVDAAVEPDAASVEVVQPPPVPDAGSGSAVDKTKKPKRPKRPTKVDPRPGSGVDLGKDRY